MWYKKMKNYSLLCTSTPHLERGLFCVMSNVIDPLGLQKCTYLGSRLISGDNNAFLNTIGTQRYRADSLIRVCLCL